MAFRKACSQLGFILQISGLLFCLQLIIFYVTLDKHPWTHIGGMLVNNDLRGNWAILAVCMGNLTSTARTLWQTRHRGRFQMGFPQRQSVHLIQILRWLLTHLGLMSHICVAKKQFSFYLGTYICVTKLCPFGIARKGERGPVSLRLMTLQFKDIVTHTQK